MAIHQILKMCREDLLHVVNKLKSKEAYLEGDGHMVSRVSWGPEEGAGSHAAGFRVPGAVGERANNIHNAEIKHSLNYYTDQFATNNKRKSAIIRFVL